MKMSGNTILITGGSSGIGFELAKQLLALGNTIVVSGRNAHNLEAARGKLRGFHAIQSDVSEPGAIRSLHEQVVHDFPALNMLINCAGIMRKIDLQKVGANIEDVTREVDINLNGTIWMDVQFLPHFKRQDNAAIVNISSGLAFVPMPISPIYSATKTAIHAFTLSLRVQLKNTNIKVFELAPPGTDTPLFHGEFTKGDTGGMKPMPVETLAKRAIAGMEKDVLEIRPGLANALKLGSRIAPNFMLNQTSKSVDLMHAQQDG
ncbi:MAG: short-chain dehydrogenase/reductase [Bradyrhizobium sp.]|jgi:uncharacterized oxidoreductase|nr:short-chain dehydrogenase/reductase [Bradyrhizobium sp.]MEA2867207.1 putative oxidoreductase [Bradyrhizobium sp.]